MAYGNVRTVQIVWNIVGPNFYVDLWWNYVSVILHNVANMYGALMLYCVVWIQLLSRQYTYLLSYVISVSFIVFPYVDSILRWGRPENRARRTDGDRSLRSERPIDCLPDSWMAAACRGTLVGCRAGISSPDEERRYADEQPWNLHFLLHVFVLFCL